MHNVNKTRRKTIVLFDSLIDSVSFNQLLSLDDNCVQSNNNGTIITTCSSSGEDYDNATYSLTFTIETVEFDKYKDV